jgi:hypothetical protein
VVLLCSFLCLADACMWLPDVRGRGLCGVGLFRGNVGELWGGRGWFGARYSVWSVGGLVVCRGLFVVTKILKK